MWALTNRGVSPQWQSPATWFSRHPVSSLTQDSLLSLRDFADLNSKRWAMADVKNQMRTHRIRQYVLHRYPACTGSLTLQLFSYDFNSKYSTKQKTPPTKHVKKQMTKWTTRRSFAVVQRLENSLQGGLFYMHPQVAKKERLLCIPWWEQS